VAIHLIYEDVGSSGYYSNVAFNATIEVVEKPKLVDMEGIFMYLMIIAALGGSGGSLLLPHGTCLCGCAAPVGYLGARVIMCTLSDTESARLGVSWPSALVTPPHGVVDLPAGDCWDSLCSGVCPCPQHRLGKLVQFALGKPHRSAGTVTAGV
jgi:hypothetical protein